MSRTERVPCTGLGVDVPIWTLAPSWPCVLDPQQYALSPVVTPQVWPGPTEMLRKLSPPATVTGTLLLTPFPSPSKPRKLLPQQKARFVGGHATAMALPREDRAEDEGCRSGGG